MKEESLGGLVSHKARVSSNWTLWYSFLTISKRADSTVPRALVEQLVFYFRLCFLWYIGTTQCSTQGRWSDTYHDNSKGFIGFHTSPRSWTPGPCRMYSWYKFHWTGRAANAGTACREDIKLYNCVEDSRLVSIYPRDHNTSLLHYWLNELVIEVKPLTGWDLGILNIEREMVKNF